ncbi:hypothetical protein Tco_1348979, partial [Tanacetum coccineum]
LIVVDGWMGHNADIKDGVSVENSVVEAPCGVMDRMASTCGEANKLLAMPAEVLGLVDIPSYIRFRGIDSGLRHSIRGADYGSVRTGAFMGRKMIKSTASDIFLQSYLNGNGNNLDELEEFEAIYSNNLSDTLSGEAFLTKYDHHNDPVIVIYNKRPCGVKAATRHPIYENFPVKEIRRRRQQIGIVAQREEETSTSISLRSTCCKAEKASPVLVDIFVAQRTRVLVVTGPNTRGKTIIVRLAAMMEKAGMSKR